MIGSFLFVKPSDPNGRIKTAYSGESPQYPYDHASWEWLLERALRRTLIPWALTKSHSRELLSGHEDTYSMHRWGSYGESYDAGSTPPEYKSVGGPGAYNRKTDADLSRGDREKSLPKSWDSSKETPVVSSATKVAYGIVDLEETVANLPFSLEWLHPDWSPSALGAWDLTASTTETTQYLGPDSNGDEWWRTTVDHTPYEIPKDYPFKCLSHMRTDDPTIKVNITNDDNEEIEVETAPTPVSAPRTTDGSIYEYNGTLVRSASHGAAYKAGWTLSEFYIQHRDGLDYSESITTIPYERGNKTFEDKNTGSNSTIGCLVDIPNKDSGNIVVWQDHHDYHEWTGFAPEVDWGGKQTWWHANDFPKGLDSVLSPKLRTQLNTLCPECQPAIPPTVPAFENGFPDAESLPWKHSSHAMYPQAWMRHLALACTPFDMSARLDAMTTTVHRVPKLFAKIKMVTTIYKTSRSDGTGTDSDGSAWRSWKVSTYRRVETVEGASSKPILAVESFEDDDHTGRPVSVSGQGDSVTYDRGTESHHNYDSDVTWNTKNQYTWEESCESNSDFLVCLRSTANTTLSTKVTTKTYTTEESSSSDPSSTELEESDGNLPDSYDPGPDDLLFPDWVLPWIDSAELFASIESRLGRANDVDSTVVNEYRYTYIDYPPREDEELIASRTVGGSGTRTHEAHRKIVSLGSMDTSTGRFPAIDAAAILSKVDPDDTEPTGYVSDHLDNYDITATITTEDGNKTKKETVVTKANNNNSRSRSVSYYVVVKWKFDRDDPETLKTESPLADLYRKLADARKALDDAEDTLTDAEDDLAAADAALVSARAARAAAQAAYENPEDAKPALLAEAGAALDDAEAALNTAQGETTSAQAAYASAESALQTAENNLQEAQAAYDAAVEAGEGVEEAEAALETAYAANYEATKTYGKASDRLANAEVDKAVAQAAYDAAKYYYDTLDDNLKSILLKAYNDAKEAFDKATAKYNEWTQKVAEAQEAVEDLEDAVAAAEQAIRDAGGVVP